MPAVAASFLPPLAPAPEPVVVAPADAAAAAPASAWAGIGRWAAAAVFGYFLGTRGAAMLVPRRGIDGAPVQMLNSVAAPAIP